jgi:molybdenum cofactor synthesis domain-containing protein
MSNSLEIVSVNTSPEKGMTKSPQASVCVNGLGILGDAHAGPWHRQVSLLGVESIEGFASQSRIAMQPGAFGENLTVRGLPSKDAAILDRFQFGDVELEITQIGKKCHGTGCTIFQQVGKCVMPAEGVFCRVLHGGTLKAGQTGCYLPRSLRISIVTLSDRAVAGIYSDRSGPRIAEIIRQYCSENRWQAEIQAILIADDAERLQQVVRECIANGADFIFTTGGTGVGPKDHTPDAVRPLCDKLIPGIMENIRMKFGEENPNALLSRSIAGVIGKAQVYTLPGSVRAVEQYLSEILKTLEHLVFMLRGIDAHH